MACWSALPMEATLLRIANFAISNCTLNSIANRSCNTGVYLRGRYEVQIADNAGRRPTRPTDWLRLRIYHSVSADSSPSWNLAFVRHHPDRSNRDSRGRWSNHHRQKRNSRHHRRSALDSHEGLPGPIYLQGAEAHGGFSFRNIVITPAQD